MARPARVPRSEHANVYVSTPMDVARIGEHLGEWRKARGMKFESLSVWSGLSTGTLKRVLSGKGKQTPVKTLVRIATALNLTIIPD